MAKKILNADANKHEIQGIALWEYKDRYPVVSAGSTDETRIGEDDGTLNGNWIRIRNFVNDLRARIDNGFIVDASETEAGKVSVIAQVFSGLKGFVNGISVGSMTKANGVVKWFSAANSFTLSLLSSHTGNRALVLPDKDGTLATLSDVSAAANTLMDAHKDSGDHDNRYRLASESLTTIGVETMFSDHAESDDHDAHNDSRYASISSVAAVSRRRVMLTFGMANSRAVFNNYIPSGISDPLGLPMIYSGCVIGFAVVNSNGGVSRKYANYNDQGEHYFRAGDLLSVLDIGTDCQPMINGAGINVFHFDDAGAVKQGVIVLELDN